MRNTSILSCLFIMVIFVLAIISCDDKVGYADAPDFSSGPFIVKKEGLDSTFVSKNNVEWQFLDLTIDGKQLVLNDKSIDTETKKSPAGVDNIYLIKGEWFSMEKLDNKRIQISIGSNEKNELRTLDFTIHNGNGFRKISIKQEAK